MIASWMMSWSVSKCMELVHVGILIFDGFSQSGPPRSIISLHLAMLVMMCPWGRIQLWSPNSWTISWRQTIITLPRFLDTRLGTFILSNSGGAVPHCTSWIPSGWSKAAGYEAIRAICFGIKTNIPNFYTILELHCHLQGRSSRLSENWWWRFMRCGKCPISLRVVYHTKNTFHVMRNWNNWRRRNRHCTRPAESSCGTFSFVSSLIPVEETPTVWKLGRNICSLS